MDDESLNLRLSKISTSWSMLAQAHLPDDTQARASRLAFIHRYQRAAYRYLIGSVRNADAADELFQEFALRFMEGRFQNADSKRGRFRDYLKTTLRNLVTDYYRRRQKHPLSFDVHVESPSNSIAPTLFLESEDHFLQSWREELLVRTWEALEAEDRRQGTTYHAVLKFRTENDRASSEELAAHLTGQLHPERPITDVAARKALQRARRRFASHLVDEVAHSLGEHTPDELEQDLIDLDLLRYCQSEFRRRSQKAEGETP